MADIAAAHGLGVFSGDGNDVLVVAKHAKEAVEKMRRGEGPMFLEFKTNRWMGHVGPDADDALGYRPDEPPLFRENRCPLKRARQDLEARLGWVEHHFDALERSIHSELTEAFRFAEESPFPDPRTRMDYVYAK